MKNDDKNGKKDVESNRPTIPGKGKNLQKYQSLI